MDMLPDACKAVERSFYILTERDTETPPMPGAAP